MEQLKHIITIGFLLFFLFISTNAQSQCNTSTGVGGTVFRDFNHNGNQDPATADFLAETGFANVTVTAIGDDGAILGTAMTDATGAWFINDLPAGERVLIQYEPAEGTCEGAFGASSNSETELIEVGKCGLISSVAIPSDYRSEEFNLLGSCISDKYQTAPRQKGVYITSAWDITDNATLFMKKFGETDIAMTPLSFYNQTGNLFGVAYAKTTKQVFGANYIRSGAIETENVGKIFRYDVTTNTTTAWADLPSLGFSAGSPIDLGNPTNHGEFVGRTGLGDLDIAEDDSELYVSNAFTKSIFILPIAADGSLDQANVKEVTLPSPCGSDEYKAVSGLGVHSSGRVYAAVTCHGPATKDIKFVIYSFDPSNANPSSTVQEELVLDNLFDKVSLWKNYSWADWPSKATVALQLWMTDIVFRLNNDGSEVMYMGTRNRNLDQSVATPGSCSINSPVPIYTAERSSTTGAWTKANLNFKSDYGTSGSLAYQPGGTNLLAMYRDCNSNAQAKNSYGGYRAYPINGGSAAVQYRALQTAFSEVLMRFNNIWADIEIMSDPAPISIGNLVWYDVDADGIRDTDEAYASGVSVSLYKDTNGNNSYDSSDKYIETTITDGLGHYYFTNLLPNMKYFVALNNSNDFATGGVLEGGTLTTTDAGNNDKLDSDATLVNGIPVAMVMTQNAGKNNYTVDFGVIVSNPPMLPPPGCYTPSSAAAPKATACLGELADPWEINVFNSPEPGDQLKIVSFPSKQTGTDMYTGGTVLATETIVDNKISYTPVVGASAETIFLYAIIEPTPPNAACRPFAELELNIRDCSVIPDLKLTKDIDMNQVALNSNVTYTLTVKNEGTLDATGVTVDEPLHAALALVNSSPTKGDYTAGIWTIGDLAIDEEVTLTITATVTEVGLFYNTAEIASVNEGDKDSTPSNKEEKEDDMDRECVSVPVEICPGETYTLSVDPAYTDVQWFFNGDTIPDATDNSYTATEEGVYTLTALYKNRPTDSGCGFELKIKTGIEAPILTAVDTILCAEENTTLTVTNGANYSWSTGETTASINVAPLATTIYTVTLTVPGCATPIEKEMEVIVNSKPSIYMFSPLAACLNGDLELSAIGGVEYNWSNGATGPDVTYTPTTLGNQSFSVEVTNAEGCTSQQAVQVEIKDDCGPCPTLDIAQSVQTCCYGSLPESIDITISDLTIDSIDIAIMYEEVVETDLIYDDFDLYYIQTIPVVNGLATWQPFNINGMFEGDLADTRDAFIYAGLRTAPTNPTCRPFAFQKILINRKPICPPTDINLKE